MDIKKNLKYYLDLDWTYTIDIRNVQRKTIFHNQVMSSPAFVLMQKISRRMKLIKKQ